MSWRVEIGDCREVLRTLEAESVQTVVTSPPYWGLRDYGLGPDALGLEPTPDLYVERLVGVFREVRRVLRKDGTLWLNLGDSYGRAGGDTRSGFNARYHGKEYRTDKQAAAAESRPSRAFGKPKDLVGVPWLVAFALRADGWYLRAEVIWAKPNPMPESVTDRPTRSHEQLFLLTRSSRYFYDGAAVRESAGANTHGRGSGREETGRSWKENVHRFQ